jgi:hypothetical protein
MQRSRDDQAPINPFVGFSNYLAAMAEDVTDKASRLEWHAVLWCFVSRLLMADDQKEPSFSDGYAPQWEAFLEQLNASDEGQVATWADEYKAIVKTQMDAWAGKYEAIKTLKMPSFLSKAEGGSLEGRKAFDSDKVGNTDCAIMSGVIARYLMLTHANPFEKVFAYFKSGKVTLKSHQAEMKITGEIVADIFCGESIKEKLKKASFASNPGDKAMAYLESQGKVIPSAGFYDFHRAVSRLKFYDERVLALKFIELSLDSRLNPFVNLAIYLIVGKGKGVKDKKIAEKMRLFYDVIIPGRGYRDGEITAYLQKPYMPLNLADPMHYVVGIANNIAVEALAINQFRGLLKDLYAYPSGLVQHFYNEYQVHVEAGLPVVNIFSCSQRYLDRQHDKSLEKTAAKQAVFQALLEVMEADGDNLKQALMTCLRDAKYLPKEKPSIFDPRLHQGAFASYVQKIAFFTEAELKQQYQHYKNWMANDKPNALVAAPQPAEPQSAPSAGPRPY